MIELRDLRFAYAEGGFGLHVRGFPLPRASASAGSVRADLEKRLFCIWSLASSLRQPAVWIRAGKSLPPCRMRRGEIFASLTSDWCFRTSRCWIT